MRGRRGVELTSNFVPRCRLLVRRQMRERLRRDVLELSGLLANFSIPLWQLAIFPALSSALSESVGGRLVLGGG